MNGIEAQVPIITESEQGYTVNPVTTDLNSVAKLGSKKLTQHIFEILCDVSRKNAQASKQQGALIVLGTFAKYDYQVPGVRQIRDNPLASQLVYIDDENGEDALVDLFRYDGAILIDQTGQMLCARAYLVVDEADITIDEECNTRHLTAASVSHRPHVIACFTISEETGKVRYYVDGKQEDMYDPSDDGSEKTSSKLRSSIAKRKQKENQED